MEPFPQLIHSAKERDAEAIGALYQHFSQVIFGYIRSHISDQSIVEDLTSDVFLKMVEHIHKVKANNEAAFAAWLFQVARNVVIDYTKAHVLLDPIDESIEYHCVLEQNYLEIELYLSEIFSELTEEQRVVITGCLMMDYDAETVGEIIGKSAYAVRALQYRALKSMKRMLSKRKDLYAIIS